MLLTEILNHELDTWEMKLHPLFAELRLIFLMCQTGVTYMNLLDPKTEP